MPNHWANIRDLAYVNCLFKLDVQLRERCGRSFQDDFADSSFHFSKLSKQFFLKKKNTFVLMTMKILDENLRMEVVSK